MSSNAGPNKKQDVRQIVSSQQELQAAVINVIGHANRGLAILTPDLEPEIYDNEAFLDALKRFLLARSFARVRVLVSDPNRTIKLGNRLVDMGRRLTSYIEFRNLNPEYREEGAAYFIADNHSIVYRPRHDSWDGICDIKGASTAQRYLDAFDELWNASEPYPELRRLEM